jgi:hypothetical protein
MFTRSSPRDGRLDEARSYDVPQPPTRSARPDLPCEGERHGPAPRPETVRDSVIGGCLVRNDRADAKGSVSLRALGGAGNVLAANALGVPPEIDPAFLQAPGRDRP